MAAAPRPRTVAAMVDIALPRSARALVAALAVVVLFACAGPASAAPRAASSATPSACATAAKKLRAAKARLAKVQRQAKRGRASRAAVARARTAVKKAGAAKRRACAAPATPGGTPVGTPTPPAGTPEQPAPPPPAPPPPGDQPTSHELIQKALDEGRIDSETALRYRVFAEFGDDRLPGEFRGAPLGSDSDSLDEVAQRWDQLSPDTRAALEPFFIPPFNPGSWYDLSSGAARNAAARSAAAGEQGSNLCENTAPNMNRWGYVTAAGGKVRVWYENTQPGQLDKAIAVAEYLDAGAWSKVTGIFREPMADGGDLTGRRCRGFDPAVDLVLSKLVDAEGRLLAGGRTIDYKDKPDCQGPVPGFVLLARQLAGKELMANVVHELAHLTHFAYSLKHCRQNISWLTEATAAWTENYVGGLGPEHPEKFAPWFFDRPDEPLETYEPETATPRHYGSYLFFQWLAKTKGADAVSKIWASAESGADPIDTIQQVLTELGFAGGFEEAWKRFALAGLNPRQDVDWFKHWGLATGAKIDRQPGVYADGDGKTFPVALPHLSAEYHWVDFTDAVKAIQVTNGLAGVPGASVQLWLRINQGGQDRYEVRDVSGEETTTFCRDLPAENVQEMALVIANSTHADRIHKLNGSVNVKGRPSCSKWDGTTKTTIEQDGLTEVYLANYTFEPQWTRPLDGGGTESYFLAQGSYDMHASWSISGVSETDGCTYSGGTSWPAGVVGLQAQLDLRDAGEGNPATTYDFGFGLPFKSMMVQRVCPDGYTGPVYRQLGLGFMSQPHPWDPTDESIIGSETQDYGGVTIKREWTLSRNGIAP